MKLLLTGLFFFPHNSLLTLQTVMCTIPRRIAVSEMREKPNQAPTIVIASKLPSSHIFLISFFGWPTIEPLDRICMLYLVSWNHVVHSLAICTDEQKCLIKCVLHSCLKCIIILKYLKEDIWKSTSKSNYLSTKNKESSCGFHHLIWWLWRTYI